MQFINNLRGVAILLIVFTHAISAVPQPGDVGYFLDYVLGNGTVVFMFIAGYLFSSTLDGYEYGPYLKNKFLSVILPYIFIATPAILTYLVGIKNGHGWIDLEWLRHNFNPVVQYFYILAMGAALGPLWFIPMVVLYFIASPAFKFITRSNLLIPAILLTTIIAFIVGRPPGNSNPLQSFVFYLPSYLLGIASHVHLQTLLKLKPISGWLLAGYLAIYIIFYFTVYDTTMVDGATSTMLFYLPLTVLLTVFFAQYLDRRNAILDMFARLSFFIFFIHGYFSALERAVLRRAGLITAIENPFIEVIVIIATFLAIIVMSLAVYVVLKLITRDKSRYIIGG